MTHVFPDSMLRAEGGQEKGSLRRLDGGPPGDLEGLHGSWFVVTPGGYVAGSTNPEEDLDEPEQPCINGDGHIFRIDLSPEGLSHQTARVEHLSQKAEKVARADRGISRFYDMGVTRVSPYRPRPLEGHPNGTRGLGVRNFSNTALVPVGIPMEDGSTRPALVVTYDAGRPLVVCPQELSVVGAVGALHQWTGQLFRDRPFPFINATAHPAWAPAEEGSGCLYVVNYFRDISWIRRIGQKLESPKEMGSDRKSGQPDFISLRGSDLEDLLARIMNEAGSLRAPKPGVLLGVWGSAAGAAEAWDLRFVEVVQPSDGCAWNDMEDEGRPIVIQHSIHQMAVTERYVIFADAAFKFEEDSLIPEDIAPSGSWAFGMEFMARHRRDFSKALEDKTPLWAVERSAVQAALAEHQQGDPPPKVKAVALGTIEAPVIHFFVDGDDSGQDDDVATLQVTAVHHPATDPGEFVHATDRQFSSEAPYWSAQRRRGPLSRLIGFFTAGYDPNEVAQHTFRIRQSGTVQADGVPSDIADDWLDHGWMLGLPTGMGVLTGHESIPARVDRVFLGSLGLAPELATQLSYDLYKDHRGRTEHDPGGARTSLAKLKELLDQGGLPGGFLAARREGNRLVLQDFYPAKPGMVFAAAQHVPAPQGVGGEGWVCVAVFRAQAEGDDQATREVWIFSAAEGGLEEPVARFDATPLGWRMPFHAAWLPDLGPMDAPWPAWLHPVEKVPLHQNDAAWEWFARVAKTKA